MQALRYSRPQTQARTIQESSSTTRCRRSLYQDCGTSDAASIENQCRAIGRCCSVSSYREIRTGMSALTDALRSVHDAHYELFVHVSRLLTYLTAKSAVGLMLYSRLIGRGQPRDQRPQSDGLDARSQRRYGSWTRHGQRCTSSVGGICLLRTRNTKTKTQAIVRNRSLWAATSEKNRLELEIGWSIRRWWVCDLFVSLSSSVSLTCESTMSRIGRISWRNIIIRTGLVPILMGSQS